MGEARPYIHAQDLGRVTYDKAWAYQTELHDQLVARKRRVWKGESVTEPAAHHFLLCEHPHVYTLGKSGSEDHVLLSESQRLARGISYYKINRGGDITYHGPGQIVGYPILDLEDFFRDVHRYVRNLEEVIIRVLADHGLSAGRVDGYTGVWLPPTDALPWRKICAIGVHLSRWVSLHGFAFNVNTDLSYFQHIVPCGITDQDKTVTSLAQELDRELDVALVKSQLLGHFEDVFHCSLSPLEEVTC